MFHTILIANRGEIACRIIRTAQSMGIRCIAVHSDIDVNALHVEMADGAISLGGRTPADSYLRGDAIIDAALTTGAQAIHPGYGFLSENPDFVDAVTAAGLVFVGPSGKAIRAMGLKDAAKALMQDAGVPVVPGYHGADQMPETLEARAAEIGYPVLIKAVAGGGGKGMRLVEAQSDFAAALRSAQNEAATAFGNQAVLVEKFVSKPRHIEVQVFGDGTDAMHLFERDCSLQRRHQKVIEEAPAPGMTDELRAEMGAAAVRAAKAIGYSGAGTVEFIVDASEGLRPDRFFFMEMNTRLQVEHPVTECITGIDLVEWQLRVAAGETLQSLPTDLQIQGHALEARVYAEDASNGFLPVTGRLTHLQFPDQCRADSGVRAGDEISPFYDPMIAKVITSGPTRTIALARLRKALQKSKVVGTTTNINFLDTLCGHPDFQSGDVDTGLIARDLERLIAPNPARAVDILAAALSLYDPHDTDSMRGFSLWAPIRQCMTLAAGETSFDIVVEALGRDECRFELEGKELVVTRRNGSWWCAAERLPEVHRDAGCITVFGASTLRFEAIDPFAQSAGEDVDEAVLTAPMPGLVKDVFAKPGDTVCKGDSLMTLEAMKMEHLLTASRDAIVAAVHVSEGDQVAAGAVLLELEESNDT